MKQWINDRALAAKVWWRDRKERAEQQRTQADPPGVTIMEWQVRAAYFASWVATVSLMYFLWLYTLDIARDRAGGLHLTHVGSWVGELMFWFPYIIGFAIVAFGIPYVAKIAVPTFMSLHWRGQFWPKLWSLIIAIAVSLVVIAGTFTVQGDTLMERDRDAAVAVEGVQQEAAVLASRIADKRAELDDMVNNASVYVRTAASMSPAAYDVFLEQRRSDWQYDRLVSYRATSVDAQRLRDEITALRDQQARQTTVASVQGEVATARTSWIADTLGWLEGVRAILLSLVMDIVALMMPWIALRLEQARSAQLSMGAGIPQHSYMLEDQTAEASPVHAAGVDAALDVLMSGGSREAAAEAAQAAVRPTPIQNKMYDEDGNEIEPVNYPRFRKKPDRTKKGKKQQVEVQASSEVKVPLRDSAGRVTGYAEFTARDVVEKDGRSAAPQAPDEAVEPAVVVDAEPDEIEAAEDAGPAEHVDDVQPEPSETALADLDTLATLSSADEPEQHSTDDRADDAPAEEVSEPAIVADETDAVAEDEDVLHDEPQHDEHVRARALLPAA